MSKNRVRYAGNITVDSLTSVPIGIGYPHYEVHNGNTYFYSKTFTVNPSATANVFMSLGTTKYNHFVFEVASEAKSEVILYEGAGTTVFNTTVTPVNMNRASTNTTQTDVYINTNITTTGSQLANELIPGGGNLKSHVGGDVRSDTEWILKKNTKYRLQVENQITTTKQIFVGIEYYEESNS